MNHKSVFQLSGWMNEQSFCYEKNENYARNTMISIVLLCSVSLFDYNEKRLS